LIVDNPLNKLSAERRRNRAAWNLPVAGYHAKPAKANAAIQTDRALLTRLPGALR